MSIRATRITVLAYKFLLCCSFLMITGFYVYSVKHPIAPYLDLIRAAFSATTLSLFILLLPISRIIIRLNQFKYSDSEILRSRRIFARSWIILALIPFYGCSPGLTMRIIHDTDALVMMGPTGGLVLFEGLLLIKPALMVLLYRQMSVFNVLGTREGYVRPSQETLDFFFDLEESGAP